MYSVIQEFWNYWASLTDHVTEKLQTNVVLVSTKSRISVALSHSKGGWKLKLNAPKNLGNSLNWKKDTCEITHFVYPGAHVHRATLPMEQLQAAVAVHRSFFYMSQTKQTQDHWAIEELRLEKASNIIESNINSVLLTHH